jgi:hypothetical protein
MLLRLQKVFATLSSTQPGNETSLYLREQLMKVNALQPPLMQQKALSEMKRGLMTLQKCWLPCEQTALRSFVDLVAVIVRPMPISAQSVVTSCPEL